MIRATCINKNRDYHGRIISYTLRDGQNQTRTFKASDLKLLMKKGEIDVKNLQIDTLGRMVDKSMEPETKQTNNKMSLSKPVQPQQIQSQLKPQSRQKVEEHKNKFGWSELFMHTNPKGRKVKVYHKDHKRYYMAEGLNYTKNSKNKDYSNAIDVYIPETHRVYMAQVDFTFPCVPVLSINNRECKVVDFEPDHKSKVKVLGFDPVNIAFYVYNGNKEQWITAGNDNKLEEYLLEPQNDIQYNKMGLTLFNNMRVIKNKIQFTSSVKSLPNAYGKIKELDQKIRENTERIVRKILSENGSIEVRELEKENTVATIGDVKFTADTSHSQLLNQTIQRYGDLMHKNHMGDIDDYKYGILYGKVSGVVNDDDIPGVYSTIIGDLSHYELYATCNKLEFIAWIKRAIERHIKKSGITPQNVNMSMMGEFWINNTASNAGINNQKIFNEVKLELCR